MPTVAEAFQVPAQLVSFKPTKRSFTILNSGPTSKSPMFVGNLLTIPAVHEFQYGRDEKSNPILLSDTDADGDPIPGTRVIEDIYSFLPDLAEDVLVFDAMRAVCHILGLQPGSDGRAVYASSPFALNGMTLLPRNASKAEWKAAAAAGEKRAFVAEVERARIFLSSIDEVNAIRKKSGLDPTVPDMVEYKRAQFVLEQYNSLIERDIKMAPHQVDKLNDDLEFEIWAKAKALELATQAAEGKTIDRLKLAEELLADPSIRTKLQKKFRIRKVGEMPDQQTRSRQQTASDAAEKEKAEAKAVAAAALDEVENDSIDTDTEPEPEPN